MSGVYSSPPEVKKLKSARSGMKRNIFPTFVM